jgi:hypothetical protein
MKTKIFLAVFFILMSGAAFSQETPESAAVTERFKKNSAH